MYKAIICDDDEIITEGLKAFLPWKDLGVELCGTAYDGQSAKELIDRFQPDIMISDVRMPMATGIELTRYAKRKNPDIKAIIISGYDNFRYAQEAIKAEAMDYLLKPLDEDELLRVLKKAIADLDRIEAENTIRLEDGKAYTKSAMHCLINEGSGAFIRRYGEEKLRELENACGGICLLLVDHYEAWSVHLSEEQRALVTEMFYRCAASFRENLVLFENGEGSAACYVICESNRETERVMKSFAQRSREEVGRLFEGQTLTAVYSRSSRNIRELWRLSAEVRKAARQSFVYTEGSDIFSEDAVRISDKEEKQQVDIHDIINVKRLVNLIMAWDREGIGKELMEIETSLKANGGKSYLYLQAAAAGFYGTLIEEIQNLGVDTKEMGIHSMQEYRKIMSAGNVEEAVQALGKSIFDIVDRLEENSQHKYRKLVATAEKYIDAHYMERDLSLERTAREIHISPSYFSLLFRNETGVTFSDYLIRKRIEKAKELLRNTDLKAYEIAEKVGYDTAAYYSTAFKKATGYSPTEYKKTVLNR